MAPSADDACTCNYWHSPSGSNTHPRLFWPLHALAPLAQAMELPRKSKCSAINSVLFSTSIFTRTVLLELCCFIARYVQLIFVPHQPPICILPLVLGIAIVGINVYSTS